MIGRPQKLMALEKAVDKIIEEHLGNRVATEIKRHCRDTLLGLCLDMILEAEEFLRKLSGLKEPDLHVA